MVVFLVATTFRAMPSMYVPNNAAVLAGGGRPVDDGRTWGGRRVLRDGKTWRDTAAGALARTLLTVVLNAAVPAASGTLGALLPTFPLVAGFGLTFGAMLGDIDASFVKRRSGRECRVAFPGLDQLDFVVDTLALAFVVAPGWFAATFSLPMLAVVPMVTPMLYVVTSVGTYLLGLKNEPW